MTMLCQTIFPEHLLPFFLYLSDNKEHPYFTDPKIQSAHINTWGESAVIDRQSVRAWMFFLCLDIHAHIFVWERKDRV